MSEIEYDTVALEPYDIEYDTVALEPYDEDAEHNLLQMRGVSGWKLVCVSVFNRKQTGEFSSKYYFMREVSPY